MHKARPTPVNEPLSESRLNGVVEIVARPNRSVAPAALLSVLAALAFSMSVVSLLSFLVDAQRAHLEAMIKIRSGQARGGPGHEGFANVARGHTA